MATFSITCLSQTSKHDFYVCAAVNKNYVIGSKIVTTSGLHRNDESGKWEHIGIGHVHRRGVNQEQAAAYLLLEFWKFDAQDCYVDCYHWINETGYLSVADLSAIAREVWE